MRTAGVSIVYKQSTKLLGVYFDTVKELAVWNLLGVTCVYVIQGFMKVNVLVMPMLALAPTPPDPGQKPVFPQDGYVLIKPLVFGNVAEEEEDGPQPSLLFPQKAGLFICLS